MIRSMALAGRGDFDALVVRTAYGDDQTWVEVRGLLLAPWGEDYEAGVYFIDDPAVS